MRKYRADSFIGTNLDNSRRWNGIRTIDAMKFIARSASVKPHAEIMQAWRT